MTGEGSGGAIAVGHCDAEVTFQHTLNGEGEGRIVMISSEEGGEWVKRQRKSWDGWGLVRAEGSGSGRAVEGGGRSDE